MNNSLGLPNLPLLWPLLGCSLVVTTAVACLPTLLLSSTPAKPRPRASLAAGAQPLLVLRSSRGEWLLNGQPIAATALARLLRRQQPETRLHPSAQLPASTVANSLAWLRLHSGKQASLDLAIR
ncbi:MAG TPA: hypothetical protein DDY43_04925 [Synechococcales bacterium UBA10510]|nr:hypothetical protein [Synechococcales bacterium UBA10510]